MREEASKAYCCKLPMDMLQVIVISSYKVIANNNNNNNNNNNVVIIGAIGTISKSFRKYVSDIQGSVLWGRRVEGYW